MHTYTFTLQIHLSDTVHSAYIRKVGVRQHSSRSSRYSEGITVYIVKLFISGILLIIVFPVLHGMHPCSFVPIVPTAPHDLFCFLNFQCCMIRDSTDFTYCIFRSLLYSLNPHKICKSQRNMCIYNVFTTIQQYDRFSTLL